MEYEKQVKALRCCAGANPPGAKCPYYGESGCDNACLDKRLKDAANSIEELMAQVRDKMFELGQARELKEMEAVKTWCHQRAIAMVDWPIYQSMVACYGRDPMRKKRECRNEQLNNAPQQCDVLPITYEDADCGLRVGTMHVKLPTINPNITLMLKATMTDCGNAEEAYAALVTEVQRVYDLVKEYRNEQNGG